MRMQVALSVTTCLLLSMTPNRVLAQSMFTDDDLVGSFVFSSSTAGGVEIDAVRTTRATSATMVGVLRADGAGGVTGSRTFLRSMGERVGVSLQQHQHVESVEQTFTGTYDVAPDGSGTMWLNPTPNPPWDPLSEQALRVHFTGGGPEILRFVIAEDGRSFRFAQQFRASREEAGVSRDLHFVMRGIAETQEPLELPEPEPDPRIDILLDLLEAQDARIDTLTAQLCEVLRLLHTPQGRRESSTDEVTEACGTDYRWNDEAAPPARGRSLR